MSNGHSEDCKCSPCLDADMMAFVSANFGQQLADEVNMAAGQYQPGSQRTRYAKPGQVVGRGVVRKVSAAQVRLIKSLMDSKDTSNLVRLPGSENIEQMSLKGASDLIERLFQCADKAGKPAVKLASEKQASFASSLAERKGEAQQSWAAMPAADISTEINRLLSLPDAPKSKKTSQLEAGMYCKDSMIYRVRIGRDSGYAYAQKLCREGEDWYFESAPGMTRKLTEADKMSLEEAQAFGLEFGVCCACGRTLTNDESIKAGIGPICATKF